jgi:hypothetical protein
MTASPLRRTAAVVALAALMRPVPAPIRELVSEFERMARADLWPGFHPDTIPLAIFDGTHTWLVRHRAPPAPFVRDDGGFFVMDGRHPEVTANSSTAIGGQTTATLIPNFAASPPKRWAAVMAHETFHAFQRTRHKTWSANEGDLFTYPFDNVDALAARRLEFEALRRALAAPDKVSAACWARTALAERTARFARLGDAASTYERRGELNEGLAQYVESRAARERAVDLMPRDEYPADGIRDRIYKSGLAQGQLLDRFAPGWRVALDHADSSASLDGALAAALPAPTGDATCGVPDGERVDATARARSDSGAMVARLAAAERTVLERVGWRMDVVAAGSPLGAAGFDPLNVSRLTPTRVLHARYVKVTNGRGSLEVIGRDAITDAAGPHPLFAGIRSITLTGLESLSVRDSSGVLLIQAKGVNGQWRGATADTSGSRITVRVSG